jgi:hypothetical protein
MSAVALVRRRLAGDFEVDEWGLDPDVVSVLSPLFGLRFSLDVSGARHLPESGPALLVYNRGFGTSEPFVVARAVRLETGRHLRVAGAPDLPVAGPMLRRIGGVLDRPDEIASVLRVGHLAGVALGRGLDPRARTGAPDVATIAEARRAGVPVHPVGLTGREYRRRWRVAIGPALATAWTDGPLGDAALADAVRSAVESLTAA